MPDDYDDTDFKAQLAEQRRQTAFQMAASFPPPHGYQSLDDILTAARKVEAYFTGADKETTK